MPKKENGELGNEEKEEENPGGGGKCTGPPLHYMGNHVLLPPPPDMLNPNPWAIQNVQKRLMPKLPTTFHFLHFRILLVYNTIHYFKNMLTLCFYFHAL